MREYSPMRGFATATVLDRLKVCLRGGGVREKRQQENGRATFRRPRRQRSANHSTACERMRALEGVSARPRFAAFAFPGFHMSLWAIED